MYELENVFDTDRPTVGATMRSAFLLLISAYAVKALIDCDDVLLSSDTFTGDCNNKWKNLKPLIKPTQDEVGYAWVQRKYDKSFQSSKDAQEEIDSSPIPAVLGPTDDGSGAIYIVDHHHELAALDWSGYTDVSVTVTIVCDKRTLSISKFWSYMENSDDVYLLEHPSGEPNTLPQNIDYTDLPTYFSFTSTDKSFNDDPWRSLGSYVRKTSNSTCTSMGFDTDCMRCFVRDCDSDGSTIPFYEFKWGYFFNEALYESKWWPSDDDYSTFQKDYAALPTEDMGSIDTDDWSEIAYDLIPLCRGSPAGDYILPPTKFDDGFLPGYTEGYEPLDSDPTCNDPSC